MKVGEVESTARCHKDDQGDCLSKVGEENIS